MSVLIKGMEMPHGCANCPFVNGPTFDRTGNTYYFCCVDVEGIREKDVTQHVNALHGSGATAFPVFCPLVESSTHAELVEKDEAISRQAAIRVFYELWGTSLTRTVEAIKQLPPVQTKEPVAE